MDVNNFIELYSYEFNSKFKFWDDFHELRQAFINFYSEHSMELPLDRTLTRGLVGQKTEVFLPGSGDASNFHDAHLLKLRGDMLKFVQESAMKDGPVDASLILVNSKGNVTFSVHRCIIKAYPFFKVLFSESFEAPQQIDIFSDIDIEPLMLLMEYLYGKV
jgi:hypothetical protein